MKQWVFSAIFGLIVLASFYLLREIVPEGSDYYNEMVTLLFISISVMILFPAREKVMRRLLKSSEYESLFGGDYHHLDFIARQFTMETMVQDIFPDLLSWLRLKSGKISIQDPDRKSYTSYIFRKGEIRKRQAAHYAIIDAIGRIAVPMGGTAFLSTEEHLPREIREAMEVFRAYLIYPIVYRRRFLGVIILHDPPRHKHANRALDLFAKKAAASIHNYYLSSRIIDSVMYDREFRNASKIRNFLQDTPLPPIHGYSLSKLADPSTLCLIEFYENTEDRWIIVILCSPRNSSASGIVLSSALGHLYSYVNRNPELRMSRLIRDLRNNLDQNRSGGYRLDMLTGELQAGKHTLSLVQDGNFSIEPEPDHQNSQAGHMMKWRSRFPVASGSRYRICHRGTPILEICRESPDSVAKTGPVRSQISRSMPS